MHTVIQRIFGTTMPTPSETARSRGQKPLDKIRRSLHDTMHDCEGVRAQRMIYKINVAQTPADLWLLRSDLHQCISQAHSQSVAAERINSLIPVFEGWLPDGQLSRI